MLSKRISAVSLMLVAAALAIATVSFAAAPKAAESLDDFGLRHPNGMPGNLASVIVNYAGSPYAANDTEFAARTNGVDTSDYFLRHPELLGSGASLVVNYAGSAYASSDPEFAARTNGVDTSDYFLRHPEWIPAAGMDTSDYFLRHPELINK